MRTPALIFISLFLLFVSGLFLACGDSTGPDDKHNFPDPVDSVVQDISLDVYSVFSGELLDEIQLSTEGETIIDVPDTGLAVDMGLNIYAHVAGFYSEIYTCNDGDTLDIDLDAVPDVPYSLAGMIYEASGMSGFCYCANQTVNIIRTDGYGFSTTTDSLGRYGAKDMPPGTYAVAVLLSDTTMIFQTTNTSATDYRDFSYKHETYIRAPYIYLYPEQQSDISVEVQFLQGGGITESEPAYGDGWNVNATPEGIINGQYNYLFYEGTMPHLPIPESGWLISGDNLQGDISELLASLGFNESETEDFTDYWIPVIEGYQYYGFFYLDPDSIISLDISPVPDNILRIFFYIEPLDRPIAISSPEIPNQFSREGFAAVEWGVIGWHGR